MVHDELIVVGVDGSARAAEAVAWAADRAARGSSRLHLVHVSTPVALTPPVAAEPAVPLVALLPAMTDADTLGRAAATLLESAADTSRRARPDLTVTTELLVGAVGAELVRAAEKAMLVVLGGREPGVLATLGTLVLGSVGLEVSGHAACPTVVVRGPSRRRGPVVAGIDGVGSSDATLRFAVREAQVLGTGVVVVHSWATRLPTGAAEAAASAGLDDEVLEESAGRVLWSVVEPLSREFPDVAMDARLSRADAAGTLTDLSDGAALVVVGSHGHGGLAGLLLGSTSQSVLRHARCPVAVVPSE